MIFHQNVDLHVNLFSILYENVKKVLEKNNNSKTSSTTSSFMNPPPMTYVKI